MISSELAICIHTSPLQLILTQTSTHAHILMFIMDIGQGGGHTRHLSTEEDDMALVFSADPCLKAPFLSDSDLRSSGGYSSHIFSSTCS